MPPEVTSQSVICNIFWATWGSQDANLSHGSAGVINELELLAIPQTSQEAGATEGNNTLVNIRGVAMVYPLPWGSLQSQESQLFGSLEPYLYTQASLEWEGTSLYLEETLPPRELPKGRRPSPSRGQTK